MLTTGTASPTSAPRVAEPPPLLRLAVVLAASDLALEQVLHSDGPLLTILLLYAALHWLSDTLLVLPLAVAAVWAGQRLALHLRLASTSMSDSVARACITAMLFALLLVPGAALHDAVDGLTHTDALAGVHLHVAAAPIAGGLTAAIFGFVEHALADGFVAQAVGIPALTIANLLGRKI